MTPLNPDLDVEFDDIDLMLDEMRDSGEWSAMEVAEEQERAENGDA